MLNFREKVFKAFTFVNQPRFFNREFGQVKHSATKLKQRVFRETKPISLELRALPQFNRPNPPSDEARELSQPISPFKLDPFKRRGAIYIDINGSVSQKPFIELVDGKEVCATYCNYDVTKLTQEELAQLKEKVPHFDYAKTYNIWRQVSIEEFGKSRDLILIIPILPVEETKEKLPESITSLTRQKENQNIEKQIPQTLITQTLKHLNGDSKKDPQERGLRLAAFEQIYKKYLGLTNIKDQENLIRYACRLYLQKKGVIFKETDEYKITTNILVSLDQVSQKPLDNAKKQCIKFVFGETFLTPKNRTHEDFPKTKEKQEATIKERWEKLDPTEQKNWTDLTTKEMKNPYTYLNKKTWEWFFPDEYNAIESKSHNWNQISAKRFYLASCHEDGVVKPSVNMHTVVVENLESGRIQGIYQLFKDAFPGFINKLQGRV